MIKRKGQLLSSEGQLSVSIMPEVWLVYVGFIPSFFVVKVLNGHHKFWNVGLISMHISLLSVKHIFSIT